MSNENLKIWSAVEKTDPAFTKSFTRGGGFKGTATNATWLARRATEMFGPIGIGWGVNVINSDFIEGMPGNKVHVLHARLWYIHEGKRGEIEAFGQTEFSGKRKSGDSFIDEEAPKKSLTDATTKALAQLGFAADIHMGMYDDNKYVNELKREFSEERRQQHANDEPKQDAKNQSQQQEPASYNDQVKIEEELKRLLDKAETVKSVTDIMNHPETKDDFKKLPEERVKTIREYAIERMTALGWKRPGEEQQGAAG